MITMLRPHRSQGISVSSSAIFTDSKVFSATFTAMIIANISMIFISFGVAKVFAQILKVPYHILGTFIMMLALVGCYAYQGNMMDIYIMIFGGIFGYFFKKYKFDTSALILALVLGPMLEKNFRRGMEIAGNDPVAFFGRPITLCIMLVFVAMFVWGFIQGAKKKKKAQ